MNKDLHLDKETNELRTTKDHMDEYTAPIGAFCWSYTYGVLFVLNMFFEWIPFSTAIFILIAGFFAFGGMPLLFEPIARFFNKVFK